MGQIDCIYANIIQLIIDMIGYEAACKALLAEAQNRLDATQRQALDMDGAFAREAAQIVQEYPDWDTRFEKTADGFNLNATATKTDQAIADKSQIKQRIREAFVKYKQVIYPSVRIVSVK